MERKETREKEYYLLDSDMPLAGSTTARACHCPEDILKHSVDTAGLLIEGTGWTNNYKSMIDAARKNQVDRLQKVQSLGDKIDSRRSKILLIEAVKNDADHVVQWLVDNGVPAEFRDRQGLTPLHHAAGNNSGNVVLYLLRLGIDVDCPNDSTRRSTPPLHYDAFTPLHYAVYGGHTEVTVLLSAWKANFYAGLGESITPLHLAAKMGRLECLKIMAFHGANMQFPTGDRKGLHPIHIASTYGQKEIVRWLLDEGVPIDVADGCGNTPLHGAVWFKHRGISKMLLERGANVNLVTKLKRRTPLHFASYLNEFEVVKLLLQSGADVNAVDSSKRTSLLLAVRRGNQETVEVLQRFGAEVGLDNVRGKNACGCEWEILAA